MISKSTINTIREGLESGVYKTLRLLKILPDGNPEVLVGYNKVSDTDNIVSKLDFIIKKFKTLSPGTYELQVKSSFGNGAMVEKHRFTIAEPAEKKK
jgi:hypothetical protein